MIDNLTKIRKDLNKILGERKITENEFFYLKIDSYGVSIYADHFTLDEIEKLEKYMNKKGKIKPVNNETIRISWWLSN